jgi:hypothetical protein
MMKRSKEHLPNSIVTFRGCPDRLIQGKKTPLQGGKKNLPCKCAKISIRLLIVIAKIVTYHLTEAGTLKEDQPQQQFNVVLRTYIQTEGAEGS